MTPLEQQRQYQQEDAYANYIQQGLLANDARNQQANAVNARLEQQQRRGSELTQLDEMIASQDRYKARKNAEIVSPLYKEQQTKSNAQALAQALQGTKQVESMSYGGNPVKQSPDGKYWLENGQEVTDIANIQSNNKFDPIAASINAMQDTGNPLALASLQEQMKPKSGMDLADKLILAQQQAAYKKDIADSKPKKDTDGKMSELSKTKDIVGELTPWFGLNDKKTSEVSNIVNQGLLDPQLKNANVLEALNQAKAASSQWYKGKTDVDIDLLTKLLTQYRNI